MHCLRLNNKTWSFSKNLNRFYANEIYWHFFLLDSCNLLFLKFTLKPYKFTVMRLSNYFQIRTKHSIFYIATQKFEIRVLSQQYGSCSELSKSARDECRPIHGMCPEWFVACSPNMNAAVLKILIYFQPIQYFHILNIIQWWPSVTLDVK